MNRGKKYQESAKLVDRTVLYDANDAIALVKKASNAKFDETVELHIRTGCDGRHAEQQKTEQAGQGEQKSGFSRRLWSV